MGVLGACKRRLVLFSQVYREDLNASRQPTGDDGAISNWNICKSVRRVGPCGAPALVVEQTQLKCPR